MTSKLAALSAKFNKKKGLTTSGFGTDSLYQPQGVIPFGLWGLDRLIRGGVPVGKITQIYGEEQSCKSTLTLTMIANAQRMYARTGSDKVCAFFDAELSFDERYARALGVDTDRLWVLKPENGDEVIEMALEGIRTGELGLLVIDSIGAMVPGAMLASDIGKSMPAARARLVSDFVRRILPASYFGQTAVVCINHLSSNMKSDFHGNEILTPEGGKKLQYFSSIKIKTRKVAKPLTEGDKAVASEIVVKLEKNKTDAAYREASFIYQFGLGFDAVHDLIEVATDEGLIVQSGAFYTVAGQKYQGKAKLVAALHEQPDVRAGLEEALGILLQDRYEREVRAEAEAG